MKTATRPRWDRSFVGLDMVTMRGCGARHLAILRPSVCSLPIPGSATIVKTSLPFERPAPLDHCAPPRRVALLPQMARLHALSILVLLLTMIPPRPCDAAADARELVMTRAWSVV